MDASEKQDKVENPNYAGISEKAANQVIAMSKWLLSAFIILQFVFIFGIYNGALLIADAKGEIFQINDFLTSFSFVDFAVTTLLMLVYIFTRVFWYAVLLGLFLCFEAIADFSRELQDGFSFSDLETSLGLACLNAVMVLSAAFCMHAIKQMNLQK